MQSDVTVEVIKKIEEMSAPVVTEVDGVKWSSKNLYRVLDVKRPAPLTINTLSGLVDYLKADADSILKNGPIVHIVSEKEVRVYSNLTGGLEKSPDMCRDHFVTARVNEEGFPFDRLLNQEEFVIRAMCKFEKTPERDNLIAQVGNLKDETTATVKDDGVTQTATVKTGVHLVSTAEIKPIVILQPFRTFREIEQPESPFLLRLQKSSSGPVVALYEADGAAWKIQAVTEIAGYLSDALPDLTIIR